MTSGTNDRLNGIWGSSGRDVFAVGYSGGAGTSTILHYDGSAWSTMSTGTTNYLYLNGIWGSSGSDVFAVGAYGIIAHYDGSAWSPMTSGATNGLHGIWGSSDNDVFAVGNSGTILYYDTSLPTAYVSKNDNTCGNKSPCHQTIQGAMNASSGGNIVKVSQGTYTEAPTWNTAGTVSISGGWNEDFTLRTGTTEMYAPSATGTGSVKVLPNVRIIPN
jgi:hypothetical protein